VFLALKAHSIPPVAMSIAGLLHDNSAVVTLQNGVPWWYFLGVDGYNRDRVIHSVDPNGTLTSSIPACKLVGCVAYPAATVLHNGVVRHVEGERFPLGELDGTVSERVRVLGALLQSAGFKAPALADLRGEIWLKLWGAAVFNPLSMLTRATMVDIATNEHTRALVIRMMREVEAVATALGVSMRVPLQQRLAGAERVGEHKTSALQDLERGEPGELAALLGAVIELGGISGVDTPTLQAVYASCALLERVVVGELASAVAADTAFC
jgi:2-dehydropantoate 2-reductase